MKKFLMAVAVLACMGGVALAGPNANGTITVHDADILYTTDILSYCGLGVVPTDCERIDGSIDLSGIDGKVWKVYAAFHPSSAPRLKGMTFGISYPGDITLLGWAPCIGDPNNGAAEFPGAGWPASGTGTSLVFQNTQFGTLIECYWFAGYNYYGASGTFCLTPHPDPILGGNFADDSVPAIQDAITAFGCMGFNAPGTVECPDVIVDPEGACCIGEICSITTEAGCQGVWQGANTVCDPNPCELPDPLGACCVREECFIATEFDCVEMQGGEWLGEGTTCDPNPCIEPNPTEETSWGQIKANYR